MDSNYRIAYDAGWQDVKRKPPEEIASRLSVAYDNSSRQFTVTFFGSEYVLDCDSETIKRKFDGQVPDINDSIIMLNYLSFADEPPKLDGRWVSLKEIPNGGILFYPAFHKSAIATLVETFGHRPELLLDCGAVLGGKPLNMGSAGVIIEAFPEIPLGFVVWQGDEEVGANATVLYDPSVAKLLHIETVIGLGMYVADKLRKLAAAGMKNI